VLAAHDPAAADRLATSLAAEPTRPWGSPRSCATW